MTTTALDPAPVGVRTKIGALWASMLFAFAYVDLFSLYRSDVRADLAAGTLGGFRVGPGFLLGTTAYVLVPSAMVALTVLVGPATARWANLVLAPLYALTIVGGAIGEWGYYAVASVVEVAMLAAIVVLAWRWPRSGTA